MKTIWHNKDIWNDPKFRQVPAWAKTLYFYIYDNCDPAGFWDIDLEFANVFCRFDSPVTVDEAAQALRGFLWHPKEDLFLVSHFIEQTQSGTTIACSNPPHVKVLEAMVERAEHGVKDIVECLSKANPLIRWETPENAPPSHIKEKQRINAYRRAILYWSKLRPEQQPPTTEEPRVVANF